MGGERREIEERRAEEKGKVRGERYRRGDRRGEEMR